MDANMENAIVLSSIISELMDDSQLIRSLITEDRSDAVCVLPLMREHAVKTPKVPVCDEELVSQYTDEDFHKHFRMMKTTFLKLLEVIKPLWKEKQERGDSPVVSLTLALMITLSRQLSMVDVGFKFNVSASSVFKESSQIINILCDIADKYIKWPSAEEVPIIEQQFSEKTKIPGVIGAIDGCHVCVVPPSDQQDSYIDRKLNHSVILQGICSARKLFIDVSVGTPGRRHDITALKNSVFFKRISEEGLATLFYDEHHHLLGDSAYFCRTWCITPFKMDEIVTSQQKRFNYQLSKARVVIEHCFGLLKGRWRRLLKIVVADMSKANSIVLACCVLHNFCYLHDDFVVNEKEDPEMVRCDRRRYDNENEEEKEKGRRKRDHFVAMM